MPLLLVALALVMLGPLPDREQALYLTAVAVGLYMGAIALFVAVFWQGPRAEPPMEQAGP
jgi:multisubunit Na+/H+ antiporter MnhC subunit